MKTHIKSRLLATVQSKGNLGKSTECLARIEWLKSRSVEWQAYDLDDAHRSVFKRYPEQTKLISVPGPESANNCFACSATPGGRRFRSWTPAPRPRTKFCA